MTVDLRLHRTLVLTRSAAARLRQLASRAPDQGAETELLEAVGVLEDTASELQKRLQTILADKPSYPLVTRGNGRVQT